MWFWAIVTRIKRFLRYVDVSVWSVIAFVRHTFSVHSKGRDSIDRVHNVWQMRYSRIVNFFLFCYVLQTEKLMCFHDCRIRKEFSPIFLCFVSQNFRIIAMCGKFTTNCKLCIDCRYFRLLHVWYRKCPMMNLCWTRKLWRKI